MPVTAISNQTAVPAAAPPTEKVGPSVGPGVDKDTFLKLLVAQLKNQNPLDPADGAEFVAQLASFTQLEKTITIQQDIAAIREALSKPAEGVTAAVVPATGIMPAAPPAASSVETQPVH